MTVTDEGTRSAQDPAEWALFGGATAIGFGLLSARAESIGLGVVVGSVIAASTLAAWRLWRGEERTRPVPASEYLAAIWSTAYVTLLLATTVAGNGDRVADALFLFPPVSLLPLVARRSLDDDGDPHGRARSVAYRLHQLCGWMLTALGVVFVVSLFFIVVAPLPLVPGLLGLFAASRYRLLRSSDEPPGRR